MSHNKVTVAPHVRFTRVEGDYVLMDLRSGTYLGLDPVASHIWQSLSEHGDPARAAEELCRTYDIELNQALSDIEAWIGDLNSKGLILQA
jgi:hypothetical protein